MLSKLAIFASISYVSAHSWLECTNYDPPSFEHSAMGNFERARCSGYPRGFYKQFSRGFGEDTNYHWAYADCARDTFNAMDYTPETPMATYIAGETVYLIHPAKTHVADPSCTNSLVPSKSIKLYISSNISVDTFDIELGVLGGDHVVGAFDNLGYQRCHDFCGNLDKATCMTGWVLPKKLKSGVHSFRWTWQMTSGNYFSTCFDAVVSSMDEALADDIASFDNSASDEIIKISDTPTITPILPSTILPTSSPKCVLLALCK